MGNQAGPKFSIVRVIGALILIAGVPLMCVFFPVGLAMMLLGGVLVIAGK